MLDYQWLGASLTMFTFISLMFVFRGCTKRPTKTAVLEEKAAAEQKAAQPEVVETQAVNEKKAGAAKPYLAAKEADLPLD